MIITPGPEHHLIHVYIPSYERFSIVLVNHYLTYQFFYALHPSASFWVAQGLTYYCAGDW